MRRFVRIRGRVQGVGFRAFIAREARRLGVRGAVRNEADGSVLARLEGEETSLDGLDVRLAEGPPGSRVEGLEPVGHAPEDELSYDLTF